jgi:sodium-dependent phosphate transporter
LRTFCLRHDNAYERIWYAYPFITFITIFINSFFILWKGAKNVSEEIDNLELYQVILTSFGVSIFCSISTIPLIKYLKTKTNELPNVQQAIEQENHDEQTNEVIKINDNAEKFDNKAEEGLKYLQILTSICDSFAHGANDVANAMGPFSAVYMIYKHKQVNKNYDLGNDSYWILCIGGLGIVAGLSLYGYKIIHVLGTRISKITPSRGLCIELGSAIVIIIGSRYGWPLSTTHCQVGATTAVALLEGQNGLNWRVFYKTCIGWIMTLVIVGVLSGLFSAQGIYAPCI